MAKRINITAPFDYRWPSRAITAFVPADGQLVKDEVAEYALRKGFATAAGGRKVPSDAAPADHRSDDQLDAADLALPDSTGAGRAVDPPAGER